MTSPNDFIKRMFRKKKQSVWVAVLGKKQFGKTDFCLSLLERLSQMGLFEYFGSNVPVNAPFEVDFIEDFETLEKRCRMLNPNPSKLGLKRYLFFGSEMGKWLPKDQAWKNVDFIERLQTVRKYGLSWIGDAISRVDSRALNETHFNGAFTKLSLKVAEYEDWVTGETTILRNIPKTSIEFDTWYSANFYMESQLENGAVVPLNEEHKIVFKYLDLGSWKLVGISTQEGKRALQKVLRFHRSVCLRELAEEKDVLEPTKIETTKDPVEVTE